MFPDGGVLLDELVGEITDDADHVALGAVATPHADPRVVVAVSGDGPGRWTVGVIDLALLLTACDAFVAAHGDPRRGRKGAI